MAFSSPQKFKLLSKLSCIIFFLSLSTLASATLKVGFYRSSCPDAEAIVRKVMYEAISKDSGVPAAILRMHFHDCFIRGCDGSILLKSTPGHPAERDHPVNFPSLSGFEIIDKAKAHVEAVCPNTVSCADILAFAARDGIHKAGGIKYDVPAGRRDGRISRKNDARHLPDPNSKLEELAKLFAKKGFSLTEMVTLSGAHTIGAAECHTFTNRLYSFNATHKQDPSMDPKYAAHLKTKCPRGVPDSKLEEVDLDFSTPAHVDNHYYIGLTKNRGLLSSDQTLLHHPSTSKLVLKYAHNGKIWASKFTKGMVKLGYLDVLTGSQGEIRRHCSAVN